MQWKAKLLFVLNIICMMFFEMLRVSEKPAKHVFGRSKSGVANLLHTRIAGVVGSRIVRGELPSGTVLPNEAALGREFGVSRTALREAVRVLAGKGLVEVRRKTGTRVLPRSEWNVLDYSVLSWHFTGSGVPAGIEDLLELRRIIEPAVARLAAERAEPQDVAQIEIAMADMRDARGNSAATIEPDLHFHLFLLDASHNSFMRPFGALIRAALTASFRLTNANPAAYRRSLQHHQAVVDAIRLKKPKRAEAAMHRLLARTSKDVQVAIRFQVANKTPMHHGRKRKEMVHQ